MASAQALPSRLIGPSNESREAVARATKVLEPVAEMEYWYTEYVRLHSDRIALDLDLVHALAEGPILDVGTSPPLLLQALTAQGADAYGVDLDPGRFPGDLRIERCDIEHEPLPYPDDHFSVVNFNEIFEHLRINPTFSVREVARVLRPDGHLLMSTPNARSFAGVINFLRNGRVGWCETNIYGQYAKLEAIGHMGHVREYTAVEVCEFLHDLRFKVEHIVWRGSLDMPGHRLDRRVHSLAPFMTVVARPPA
jgi:SAM-dependent methyltransferase